MPKHNTPGVAAGNGGESTGGSEIVGLGPVPLTTTRR